MEERIKNLIEKLHTLAERGEKGEAQVAKEKLDLILSKHGLTLEDLAETEEKLARKFKYKDKWEKQLIIQIVAFYLGRKGAEEAIGGSIRNTVTFNLTNEMYIDISQTYESTKVALAQEMDIFFTAFIQMHKLGVPSNDSSGGLDKETFSKVMTMMNGLSTKGTPKRNKKKQALPNNHKLIE